MKVLIVGSGGREHAIAASVAKSPKADKIWCAPGNAGIAEYAECVDIGAMEFDKLAAFAKENAVDLCIVGMDDPLVGGLVDVMEEAGIRTFGPKKNAAILEGSKAFSKDLMKKYNITKQCIRDSGIEEHDQEGRVITCEFGDYYFVTVYTPNSQNELARLNYRMKWEDDFRAYLKKLEEKKPVIVTGDMNVAHQEIDLKNPKTNRKNAGFTDEERHKFRCV